MTVGRANQRRVWWGSDATERVSVCVCSQSCPTLCDPMDYSSPGSSVHGVLHARVLEWVAISFCRGSSQFRDQTLISCVPCLGRQVLYHCAIWEDSGCSKGLSLPWRQEKNEKRWVWKKELLWSWGRESISPDMAELSLESELCVPLCVCVYLALLMLGELRTLESWEKCVWVS